MPIGDKPVLETLADLTVVSVARCELDPIALVVVRLAALIAVDAPASSYLLHVGPAAEVGVTLELAQGLLIAVAPIVGTARTLSAAAEITEALGVAIELAIEAAGAGGVEVGGDVLVDVDAAGHVAARVARSRAMSTITSSWPPTMPRRPTSTRMSRASTPNRVEAASAWRRKLEYTPA